MTNTELAILSLIVERPRHGYEIESVIEARGMRDWTEIGFSSIYYLLKKLEAKGLITGRLEKEAGRGPAKRVFTASEEGREAWRREVLKTLEVPVQQPTPFLLGLSVLPAFPSERVQEALQAYRLELTARRDALHQKQTAQSPLSPHVEAMFDYSLTLIQAEIDWIVQFINTLGESDDRQGGFQERT